VPKPGASADDVVKVSERPRSFHSTASHDVNLSVESVDERLNSARFCFFGVSPGILNYFSSFANSPVWFNSIPNRFFKHLLFLHPLPGLGQMARPDFKRR